MNEFIYFINNNYLYIIIVVTIILSILLFISISGLNLNQPKNESKLVQEVTVEMFTENINTLGQGQGQEI